MRIKNYISKKRFSMKQVVSVLVVVFFRNYCSCLCSSKYSE